MNAIRPQDPNRQHLPLLFSSALAHLAHYLETGCDRSAYLARMVLEQVAKSSSDINLCREAGLLIEILEDKVSHIAEHAPHLQMAPPRRGTCCAPERRVAA